MYNTTSLSQQEDGRYLATKLLIFIFCPFFSFLYSLKNPSSRSSYIIYFLFGVVFCWHMESRGVGRYDDFIGIRDRFIYDTAYSPSELGYVFVKSITLADDAPKDFFEEALMSFTKWFSDNYHLFFAFASIFYLTFMLRSMKMITSDAKFETGFWGIIIMGLFVLPRDIITVQNPRYTCGLWYNIMCTLSFYFGPYRQRWVYAIMIIFSPLFHSAMWPYVFFFFGCTILSRLIKADRLYTLLFYISIPFSFLSYEIFSQFDFTIFNLPPYIQRSLDSYFSEDAYAIYISNAGRSGLWWVDILFKWLTITAYSLIPYYAIRYRNDIRKDGRMTHFFNYFLLFASIVNFVQAIPEFGTRYYYFFRIFALFIWFKVVFPRHNNHLKFVLFACSFYIFHRYFYTGAVSVCVPPGIWWKPLPVLVLDGLL